VQELQARRRRNAGQRRAADKKTGAGMGLLIQPRIISKDKKMLFRAYSMKRTVMKEDCTRCGDAHNGVPCRPLQ
jgi:ribosomal protein L44E